MKTKTVSIILLACFVWMWTRSDWQNWYGTIQYVVAGFAVLHFAIQAQKKREARS